MPAVKSFCGAPARKSGSRGLVESNTVVISVCLEAISVFQISSWRLIITSPGNVLVLGRKCSVRVSKLLGVAVDSHEWKVLSSVTASDNRKYQLKSKFGLKVSSAVTCSITQRFLMR
jgi:hypothetical protein